jgi:acyl-CoA oxidase
MSVDKVQENIVGNGVKEQLRILCNIYALNLLHKHIGDSLGAGSITPKQGALASEQLRSLYSMVLTINLNLSGETLEVKSESDLGGFT